MNKTCEATNKIVRGFTIHCQSRATEERKIKIDKPEHQIKGTITKKFCPFHANLHDMFNKEINQCQTQ